MKIYANQLVPRLQQRLDPVYLIFGDEPLQKLEAIDKIRATTHQLGFTERQQFTVDQHFDWQQLITAFHELSLFSSKKLIELTLSSGKPGTQGSKVLIQLSEMFHQDTILLIYGNKLEANITKSKWFKTLDQQGVYLPIYPLEGRQFSQWLNQRAKEWGLNIQPQALDVIADYAFGNMLAANQALQKLHLMNHDPHQPIGVNELTGHLLNQSRYNVFQLVDTLLAGNISQGIKILCSLQTEGVEPTIINWALSREVLRLHAIKTQIQAGENLHEVFKQHKIWSSKQGLYQQAVQAINQQQLQQLINKLSHIDTKIKSLSGFKPFTAFAHIILCFNYHQDLTHYQC